MSSPLLPLSPLPRPLRCLQPRSRPVSRLRVALAAPLLALCWTLLPGIGLAREAGAEAPSRTATQPAPLVEFASAEGLARLARASAKADFAALANQFEAQSNGLFCGPTSAAIVLNALAGRSAALPRDRRRLQTEDLRHLPAGADPSLPRFTQDNVIERGAKTRAQVFGEPLTVAGQTRNDFGYQLRQLDELLRANGAQSRAVVVDDRMPEQAIRAELIANLGQGGNFVIVNYLRKAVGQAGGGHISPLAAYDEASDAFLLLDVNPSAAGWVWMPADTLIRGMRTFDTVENRGYLLVAPR